MEQSEKGFFSFLKKKKNQMEQINWSNYQKNEIWANF